MSRPHLKEPRRRLTVTVDKSTIKSIERIKRTVAEVDGPSAAVRYVFRWFDAINDTRPASK